MIAFNKPFGVLSQFTDGSGRATLANYIDIDKVYPCGRLDRDSEGLLLLSNDGKLQASISQPGKKWPKTYLTQVEGTPTANAILKLQQGVTLKDGKTAPAGVQLLAKAPAWIGKRQPPIMPRKGKSTSWLAITLHEGRNRQVRRMTALVNLPTLRLVRSTIGPVEVASIPIGEYRLIDINHLNY